MTPINYKYEKGEDFVADALDAIESFIAYELEQQEIVRIALSGGNSPKEIYEALSRSDQIDWRRVEIFQVDERYTPAASESNLTMIERSLLSSTPDIRSVRTFDVTKPIEEAAKTYDELLGRMQSPRFDLVILGLGADGHTASLFPGIPELDETRKMAVATKAAGYTTEDRLSLTYTSIMDSERIMFLIRGKNKTEVVDKLLAGDTDYHELPAAKILTHPHVELYFDISQ